MSRVQLIKVGSDESEQRLDRWFRRHYPQIGQGRVEKLCRKGDIRVNGGRVKASTRVEPGQEIRVPPMPDNAAPIHPPKTKISKDDIAMIQNAVIFRDDHLIVLNKPAGLASQGGSGQTRHVDGLAEALKFGMVDKPRLVHRLDKDTSGILVLARTQRMATALTTAFRHRETRKIYWAAVAGVPQPYMGTIKYALVKSGGAKGFEKMRCVHPDEIGETYGAKRATTDYSVLTSLGRRASWVALSPITGRTHQLRAHMAEMGHPVIGDGKYGGSGQENQGDGWGAQMGGDVSRKLHLHARSLRFEHPHTKDMVSFTAPLPPHMQQTWDSVEWHADDVSEDPFGDLE